MGDTAWFSAREVIHLERYPIDQPDSEAGKQLLAKCREQMQSTGACELKGFVTDFGLEQLVDECELLAAGAYFNGVVGNAYLDSPGPEIPEGHVRRETEPTHLGVVAYDQFPKKALLRRIYEWDPLMHFIGQVAGVDEIYRYGDPMGALNLSVMRDGDYLRWHFDQTDFVSSLMIRNAEEGGAFEYVPWLRSSKEENYDRVRSVIRGSREGVVHLANEPGSLVVFKGRYSMHRVTPIRGNTSRLIGLFGFDTQPGVVSSEHLRKIRYGRTEVIQVE